MKLLGTKVTPVESGSKSLKDAMNEALRDWIATVRNTYYLIGTTAGPHPYPMIVRDFQAVIGREARRQILQARGRLPDVLVACVNGGSNAIGLFYPFLSKIQREDDWVEAAGLGISGPHHAATITPAPSAFYTAIKPTYYRMSSGRFARRIRLRRGSTIPALVLSIRG